MRLRHGLTAMMVALAAPASASSISDRIYPAPMAQLSVSGLDPAAAMIAVTTSDGVVLKGIAVPPRGKPVLLVFHGNGSSAADTIRWFSPLIAQGYGVVAAEYRGYSGNPGKPGEAGLAADADAFFAYARLQAKGAPVWVVGHSLGGGVAFGLAWRHRLDAVITIGTFTRLRAVAPKIARALIPDAYRNIDAIATLDEPYFLIHGTMDGIVPPQEGKALFDAVTLAKKDGAAFVIKGADHHPAGETLAAIFTVIAKRLAGGNYDAGPLSKGVQLVPFGATAPLAP